MKIAYTVVGSVLLLSLLYALVFGVGWNPDWMPHGHCFDWSPLVLITNVSGDLLTAIAYLLLLPVALVALARARDARLREVIYLFAAFIMLCGGGHVIYVWNIWHSRYGLQGVWALVTGVVSVWTFLRLTSYVMLVYRKYAEDRRTIQAAIAVLRGSPDTLSDLRAIGDRLESLNILGLGAQ